ncbi:hypothetical protein MKX01_009069 [Papaver californicum]|nr:hypothetical protein MKX01_009069 [Papaver californicum]
MASCDSLQQIFETPLPKKPTVIQSLSSPWNQIKPMRKPTEISSFSEMFGELNFEDNSSSSQRALLPPPSTLFPPPPSSSSNKNLNPMLDHNNEQLEEKNNLLPSCSFLGGANKNREYLNGGGGPKISYPSKKNLQMCTEGLGVESFDCTEEEKKDDSENQEKNKVMRSNGHHKSSHIMGHEFRRLSRTGARKFPPPISSIGITGKPGVSFRAFRQDGRFVLKEIRIPTQEFLHACREDGRLKLNFVHPQRRILEEQEEEEEEETASSCLDNENRETKDVTDE